MENHIYGPRPGLSEYQKDFLANEIKKALNKTDEIDYNDYVWENSTKDNMKQFLDKETQTL